MPLQSDHGNSQEARRRRVEASTPARIVVAWTLAGGLVAGGLLVASVALVGGSSEHGSMTVTPLFVLGALAGFVHGAVFGYLGRYPHESRLDALRSTTRGLLVAVPAAAVCWGLAIMIALSPAFASSRRWDLLGASGLAWLAGIGVACWAAYEGWRRMRRVFARWPEHRVGTLILLGVLTLLMSRFYAEHPTIWGTDLRVTGVGAFVLALGATIWIALPVVVLTLRLAHRGINQLQHWHHSPGH
ncbi:MAG TPA: hypothetical protein VK837_07130 [Longimicrobiales bacterium]|nr:hypothetical protein [Longimicrobiales bacterium]